MGSLRKGVSLMLLFLILSLTLFLLQKNDIHDDDIFNIAIYTDDTAICSNCNQVFDLWQQLELAFELETDIQDTRFR